MEQSINQLTDSELFEGYLKNVYNEENVGGIGTNYKIIDAGGDNATLKALNENGIWETVGEEGGLDKDAIRQQYANAKLMSDATEQTLTAANQEAEGYAAILKQAGAESDDLINSLVNDWYTKAGLTELNFADALSLDFSNIPIEGLKEHVQESINQTLQGVEGLTPEWYNNLTEEEKVLLAQVDIDDNQSIEEIEHAIDLMQDYANTRNVAVGIQAINAAENAWNNRDMVELERLYNDDEGMQWARDMFEGNGGFAAFVEKLFYQGVEFLQNQGNTLIDDFYANGSEAIIKHEGNVEDKQAEYDQAVVVASEAEARYEEAIAVQATAKSEYDEAVAATAAAKAEYDAVKGSYNFDSAEKSSGEITSIVYDLVKNGLLTQEEGSAITDAFLEGTSDKGINLTRFMKDISGDRTVAMTPEQIINSLVGENFDLLEKYGTKSDEWVSAENKYNDAVSTEAIAQSEYSTANAAAIAAQTDFDKATQAVTDAETALTNASQTYVDILNSHGIIVDSLQAEYGDEADWAFSQYEDEKARIDSDSTLTDEDKINQLNQALDILRYNLKNIDVDVAATNIQKLRKEFEELTEGTPEYNEILFEIQKNFEKVFGKKPTAEWISNNEDLIDQWINGVTELERAQAGVKIDMSLDSVGKDETDQINKAVADAVDAYNNDEKNKDKQKIEIPMTIDAESLPDLNALIAQYGLDKDFVISCIAQGDFSGLIGQLMATQDPLGAVMTMLSTIGATTLTPEGFAKLAEALGAFAATMAAINAGNFEDAEAKAKEAAQKLSEDITGAFSGYKPNVPADVEPINGSGGGSGGGSTKSSAETARDKQLQAIDDEIARSEKAREGKSPDAQHDAIMKEIELLEEQQKILEEQTDQWKELMKAKVEAFNDKYASMGFEIELTDDGMIANLSELYGRLAVELEEAEDGSKEERLLENMMDDLDDAAELQGQIDDNVATIADKEREQAEKALEDITERIDWRVKQIDYQIELLNYYQEKLLKQAHGNKQTIEAMLEGFKYQEQEMLALFEKGDTLRQGIAELNAAKAQYPDYAQMFDEQILEYQSDLIDVNMDILELRAEMEELVQNVLELALQEIDTQTQRIDKYVSMLDHFQNIIDLSGRTMLDQSLKVQIGTAKVETMVNKMGILKQQMEGLSAATKQAQDALAARRADNDESSVKFWENQVEMLKQELETATEEFLGSWEDVLEEAGNLFEMRVELAVQTMSDALSPFSSLELFQNNYNQDKTIRDQYLDDATRIYELNKLNRELNRAVTDENDLLAKSKLRDIQQQIYELQRSGVEMSQFDLEILQKKYDLQLAEIALMEAQNSKTSMRLIRDAAGNWTYAYDADEESIEDATQKYEDAIYELDQLAKEYIDDVSDQLIENQIEYKDALMDLDRNSADYQDQLLRLQEYYTNRQLYLLQELNKGVKESGITFHDTLYGQMNDIYDYETAYDQFLTNSNTTVAELMTNYKDWQSVVEEAMNVAGTSWENFSGDMGTSLESMEDYIKALCDEISKLVDVLMSYVSTSISMVEEWQEKYSKMVDENIAKNEATMNTDYINGGQWVSHSGIGPEGSSGGSSGGGFSGGLIGSSSGGSTGGLKGGSTGGSMGGNTGGNSGGNTGGNNYDNPYINRGSGVVGGEYTQFGNTELIEGLSSLEAAQLYMSTGVDDMTDDLDLLASAFDPQSGWCAKWVSDIIEASGGEVNRGHAWDMLLENGGTPYDGGGIQNGSIVGFASATGGYGHVMIYQDGYLYGTTDTGDSIGRISFEDYLAMGYESTRVAAPTDTAAGQRAGELAETVYGAHGGDFGKDEEVPESFENFEDAVQESQNPSLCAKCGRHKSNCTCNGGTEKPKWDENTKVGEVDPSERAEFLEWKEKQLNKTSDVMALDTGGYTGEWGPEGKWALLHEKELILNKKDTNNILNAVNIAKNIDRVISDLTASTNNKLLESLGYVNPVFESTPIEQTVQITAEFPGVTDQYEIQEAFANLSNNASQYLGLNKY